MKHLTSLPRFVTRAALVAALAVVPAAIPLAPAMAQGDVEAPAGDLQRAVAALRSVTTMTADFIQTDRSGQRVTGTLTLKQPGRIRFEYTGVPLLIVSDGKALTVVDYGVKQVQRWPIGNSPLGALLDPKRDIARFGRAQPTGNPDVISIEVKDPKHREFGTITMIFQAAPGAPGGMKLASWVALDAQNMRTTVVLTNHRFGVTVPDSKFAFRDPRPIIRR